MTDNQQKKTPREIVQKIERKHCFEYIARGVQDDFEQAIQAEREVVENWKIEHNCFSGLQTRKIEAQEKEILRLELLVEYEATLIAERDKLRQDNEIMREALEWYAGGAYSDLDIDIFDYIKINDNKVVEFDWNAFQDRAEKALAQITETDKYIRLRDAERAVVEKAQIINNMDTYWFHDLNAAIEILDQIQKESVGKW